MVRSFISAFAGGCLTPDFIKGPLHSFSTDLTITLIALENNNNRFLYSDFPSLRLAQTALQYTLLQLILFIIIDNYRAPPRYMTDTYNGALFKFPNYL